jgi:hypothetical protein
MDPLKVREVELAREGRHREFDKPVGRKQTLRPLELLRVANPELILKDVGPRNEVRIATAIRRIAIACAQLACNKEARVVVPASFGINVS